MITYNKYLFRLVSGENEKRREEFFRKKVGVNFNLDISFPQKFHVLLPVLILGYWDSKVDYPINLDVLAFFTILC